MPLLTEIKAPPFLDNKETFCFETRREVKQNFLSNVPAADSYSNFFGIDFLLEKFIPN